MVNGMLKVHKLILDVLVGMCGNGQEALYEVEDFTIGSHRQCVWH